MWTRCGRGEVREKPRGDSTRRGKAGLRTTPGGSVVWGADDETVSHVGEYCFCGGAVVVVLRLCGGSLITALRGILNGKFWKEFFLSPEKKRWGKDGYLRFVVCELLTDARCHRGENL